MPSAESDCNAPLETRPGSKTKDRDDRIVLYAMDRSRFVSWIAVPHHRQELTGSQMLIGRVSLLHAKEFVVVWSM